MKTTQALGVGVLAVLAYSLWRKADAAGTINWVPDKVHDLEWEGLNPVLVIGLKAQNTSNQSFTVRSIAGNVYANNYLVGNISFFQEQKILPNSEKVILVRVRLMLLGVVNDIIDAWETGHFQQKLDIKARSNVDNLQIPINFQYKIGG